MPACASSRRTTRRPTSGSCASTRPLPPAEPRVLDPYIPSLVLAFLPAGSAPKVQTPWVSFPGEYKARCESSGNATWLQVTHVGGSADRRPLLTRMRDPALGLHVLDVNIALGNLVQLVRDQAAAYHSP